MGNKTGSLDQAGFKALSDAVTSSSWMLADGQPVLALEVAACTSQHISCVDGWRIHLCSMFPFFFMFLSFLCF